MICRTCGIDKELSDTNYKKTDGGKYWAKECRDCGNAKRRAKRGNTTFDIQYQSTINTDTENVKVKTLELERDIKNIRSRGDLYMLTDEQIKQLAILADKTDSILSLLDNRLLLYKQEYKADREKKTFNLDKSVIDRINKICKKSNLNSSDLVNILLKKSFDFVDE